MYSQYETTKISKNYALKWGFLAGGICVPEGLETKIWDARLSNINGILILSHSASLGRQIDTPGTRNFKSSCNLQSHLTHIPYLFNHPTFPQLP